MSIFFSALGYNEYIFLCEKMVNQWEIREETLIASKMAPNGARNGPHLLEISPSYNLPFLNVDWT